MRLSLVLPFLATALTAQKVLLPDGSGRQMQLFDLHALRVDGAPGEVEPPAAPPSAEEAADAGQGVATLLRRFIEPPLGPLDDVVVLGGRWLAMLGTPEQIAAAERLVRLATEKRDREITIEVQLVEVPDPAFTKDLRQHLVAVERDGTTHFEAVLEAGRAKDFVAAVERLAPNRLDLPRLVVFPLQRANVSMIQQTSFVKDFTVSRVDDKVIADPIIDIVWDGNVTDVIATHLPDEMIGLSCDVLFQQVQRPIARFETTVGAGAPVTIELPRVTGTRLQQTAVVGADSLVVLAARKVDGAWIVASLRARAQRQK